VVISSVQGKLGIPFRSAYAASKHALHGFFDSARFELEKQGIAVTLVCPGKLAPFIGGVFVHRSIVG